MEANLLSDPKCGGRTETRRLRFRGRVFAARGHGGVEDESAMWRVKGGKLYCGADPVPVRRVVVEIVAGRTEGPIDEARARHMLRLERALSIRDLAGGLARPPRGR
jgi:hypothetical protein